MIYPQINFTSNSVTDRSQSTVLTLQDYIHSFKLPFERCTFLMHSTASPVSGRTHDHLTDNLCVEDNQQNSEALRFISTVTAHLVIKHTVPPTNIKLCSSKPKGTD
jgi:hypothetical protein